MPDNPAPTKRGRPLPVPPTLLLTRPQAASLRFADAWRARHGDGAGVIIAPVVEIRLLPVPDDLDRFAALIFTSQNGVAAVAQGHEGMLAWCVGEATAEAARDAGFVSIAAGGTADGLVEAIAASGITGTLLHLRGREARGDVAAWLRDAGIGCEEAVVYEQLSMPLSVEARAVLAGSAPVVLPLFSPRSAERLAGQLADLDVTALLFIAAMSPAVAEAWTGPAPRRLHVAAHPSEAGMLAALDQVSASP